MLLQDVWQFLEATVFVVPSTPALFNMYNDASPDFDTADAAAIRRENVKSYLSYFVRRPAILLIGEAPGPKGCRFSGVPFTSEFQLASNSVPFRGRQSSLRERPYREATATAFWAAIRGFEADAFVWNCVPFHPHAEDAPLSIRTPTLAETERYSCVLMGIVERLDPECVVSVGNQAARALRGLDVAAEHVRHPSHGGTAEFTAGLRRLLASRARGGQHSGEYR